MSPLVETVLFVFGLVALGYLAGRTRYLKPFQGEALSEFAVSVALPLLLFRTMVGADFHGTAPWSLWATYFSAVFVAWACGQWTTIKLFGRDARAGVVGGVSTAFSNLVLLGSPLVLGVFGQAGFDVLSLIISVHLPTMMIASIVMFSIVSRQRGVRVDPAALAQDFLRRLFTNPLIIGIVCGLAWRMTGLELPHLAMRFIDALANIAGPLALFSMGLSLVSYGISGNVRAGVVLALMKLFLMPAVALVMAQIIGLPPFATTIAVVAAGLPAGVNSYLIATQFGTGQALASNAMTISTGFAVVSTAFWVTVLPYILG
ncbi:AEC family transporter [Mesorhizobium xinjiangense]|uniref:AEC family transporter n=1 Tax=Mesorhizobium xinjiangense TaxID=2678685 RepID=UPI0012ED267F|nr:AEC family transporter [Mesorhizobium xinjiangense]